MGVVRKRSWVRSFGGLPRLAVALVVAVVTAGPAVGAALPRTKVEHQTPDSASPIAVASVPPVITAEPTTAASPTTRDIVGPAVPVLVAAPTVPPSTVPVVTTTTIPAVPIVGVAESLAPICRQAAGRDATPIGATLGCRIITSYGNPQSKGMGILGRLPRAEMLTDLQGRVAAWQKADPARTNQCALELIVIVAQGTPGSSGLYRARTSPEVIDKVLGWARSAQCLLILDMQVGWSSVAAELPYVAPWLAQPDVHLALDPEWDMPPGVRPGTRIGTMDATDINAAVDLLAKVTADNKIGPKLLVVHRFREFMVTNPQAIQTPPEIRLVVNMDGFGSPDTKLASYLVAKRDMPTSLTGFKLFTLIDTPMLQPADVLVLNPVPVFINYQ